MKLLFLLTALLVLLCTAASRTTEPVYLHETFYISRPCPGGNWYYDGMDDDNNTVTVSCVYDPDGDDGDAQ